MNPNPNTKISIITAIERDTRLIGRLDGSLPWYIKKDFAYFKETTIGHPIIVGRKTFESFGGRILPDRPHIIITSQKDYLEKATILQDHESRRDQLFLAEDFAPAIELAKEKASEMKVNEIFIIGGGRTYENTINIADRLYVTLVKRKDKERLSGDIFFPEFLDLFPTLISSKIDSEGDYDLEFQIREK